jgi:hypothetical protein
LGTWYLAVFQKKLGTKLFIFTFKKNYFFIIFYLVLAIESISGVKSRFLAKKIPPKKQKKKKLIKKNLTTLFISLKVAHSGQEAPKKNSARWLIKKLKTIEERLKGIGCAPAL